MQNNQNHPPSANGSPQPQATSDEQQDSLIETSTISRIIDIIKNPASERAGLALATILNTILTASKRHTFTRWQLVASLGSWILLASWALYRLIRSRRTPKPTPPLPKAIIGLSPYSQSDWELFAQLERQDEIQKILSLIQDLNSPIIVVSGRSGSGKTSLLQAGLQHAFPLGVMDGGQQIQLRYVYWEAVSFANAASMLAIAVTNAAGLQCGEDLQALLAQREGGLVLIIDQFERLHLKDPKHKPIFDFIERVFTSPAPHKLQIVVSFTLEYYGEWLTFLDHTQVSSKKKILSWAVVAPASI